MSTVPVNLEDGWDLYHRASEAYKAKEYKDALRLCRDSWRAFGDDVKPDTLRNRYGYCIYQLELKPLMHTEEQEPEESESPDGTDRAARALKAAEAICSMTSQGQYSPYTMAVLALIKILKKSQGHWPEIEQWTNKLKAAELSTETFSFNGPDGKPRELASHLEQWYGARVRALLETQQYAECVEHAESYAQQFQACHYDYDVWIPSWQAKALIALNRPTDALNLTNTLVARKRNVHTLTLNSKAQEAASDLTRAWILALEAVHERAEPKHLITAVDQAVHLLERQNRKDDLWRKCVELLLRIRATEDWRIPGSLQMRVADAGIALPNPERIGELKRLLRELEPCWWRAWVEAEPRSAGIVDSVREKSCFIRMEGGKSIYAQSRSLPRDVNQGSPVDFWIRRSFDRVKNRFSEQAIHIRSSN